MNSYQVTLKSHCRLLQDGNLSIIGVVVVDELHLVSDSSRGYLLELMLTKLKYSSSRPDRCDLSLVDTEGGSQVTY